MRVRADTCGAAGGMTVDGGARAGLYCGMRSVADTLREASRRRVARLTPVERVQLAWALGDADVALMCSAQGISADDARRRIARSRQAGRVYSRSALR